MGTLCVVQDNNEYIIVQLVVAKGGLHGSNIKKRLTVVGTPLTIMHSHTVTFLRDHLLQRNLLSRTNTIMLFARAKLLEQTCLLSVILFHPTRNSYGTILELSMCCVCFTCLVVERDCTHDTG